MSGDFPPTLSVEAVLADTPGAIVTAFRTLVTKFGPKAILSLRGMASEAWATPFMCRQLGVIADPPTAKKPTARVSLPARIESFETSTHTGYKLVHIEG